MGMFDRVWFRDDDTAPRCTGGHSLRDVEFQTYCFGRSYADITIARGDVSSYPWVYNELTLGMLPEDSKTRPEIPDHPASICATCPKCSEWCEFELTFENCKAKVTRAAAHTSQCGC